MDEKQWNNKTPFPPLGTIYAASILRENGYEVSLFDTGLKSGPEQIIEILDKQEPEVFVLYDDGFNYLTKMCLTTMREAGFKMIQQAKEKGCTVLVSSSDATDHASLYLEQGADYIIYGEGEQTLLEIVESLKDKKDTHQIEGVFYKNSDGEIVKNKPRTILKDLDLLPLPAWDLIDVASYRKIWEEGSHRFTLNIATTRGCPFHCNWCAKPIYGQRYNSHSPERIVSMIEHLVNQYQVDRFWMSDDIFGLKPGWVQQFNKLLSEKSLKINYYIQSRADLLLKEDTIDALAQSGLEEVWIGAESGSQKILDAMDKGITISQIEEATQLLRSKKIRVAYFIQYGYLGEQKKDIEKTLNFIKRMKPDNIGVSVSYPLPGTPFYDKVKHELKDKTNWVDSDDLAMMFKGTFNQDYYRKLQRFTHKVFRIAQGKHNLKLLLKKPFKNPTHKLSSSLKLLYYVPTSWMDKHQLSRMENTYTGS
jgi:radical SAM superfamily enzyme YgiQ (UPF0313 family)